MKNKEFIKDGVLLETKIKLNVKEVLSEMYGKDSLDDQIDYRKETQVSEWQKILVRSVILFGQKFLKLTDQNFTIIFTLKRFYLVTNT